MVKKIKAYYLLIGFFTLSSLYISAQDQRVADSLFSIYETQSLQGAEKMALLKDLSFNETNDLDLSIKMAQELIDLASSQNHHAYRFHGYLQKGNTLRMAGDLDKALDAFMESSEAAMQAGYPNYEALAYSSIADVYSEFEDSDNAEIYYDKGISILRTDNDSLSLATALLNASDEYLKTGKFNKAIGYIEESEVIFKDYNYTHGLAYALGNKSLFYAHQGKDNLATANIKEAISILENFEDYYGISAYLEYMSEIYQKQKNWQSALKYASQSLEFAQRLGLKIQISDSNLELSEIYENTGDLSASYQHYKLHIIYRDSVINLESQQDMADLKTEFEVAQKQKEVEILELKEKRQKNMMFASILAFFVVCLFIFGLYRRYRFIKVTKSIIEFEKQRSDHLLRNILPEETALELKQNGRVQAKRFESVSVLFTDFKGFTNYAESLSPEMVVEIVDFYFSKFDEIMGTYKLEKIKTIGDAYMSAGGLHQPKENHAERMLMAAFDIIEFVEEHKQNRTFDNIQFDIRIGINTGAVVAGVVGSRKFAYDIWGDAVNVASRMESNSVPGKINISQHTYELVKDAFECEYRGELDIKNHGAMKMYFVTAIKKETRSRYLIESKLKVV